jgi:energy-coupling factor transport system permease protein
VSALDLHASSLVVDRTAPLARANPVAKLAVATVLSAGLLLTVDVVTAAAALLLEALCWRWTGLRPSAVLRRGWLVLLAAVPAGVVTAWLGVDSGGVLLGLGPITVTEGSLEAGAALLATTDPTELGDALAQVLRLPARFVLAALAGTRLLGVLGEEWQQLALARRARGLGDDHLVGRVRTAFGQVFALLVIAIRRAAVLATAMESRGFGASPHRTWARPSRFTGSDAVVVLGGIALTGLATAAGVAAGTWELVLA